MSFKLSTATVVCDECNKEFKNGDVLYQISTNFVCADFCSRECLDYYINLEVGVFDDDKYE